MEKKRIFKAVIVTFCVVTLWVLVGCGAKQTQNTAGGHDDRKVRYDN